MRLDKVPYLIGGFLMRKGCPRNCPACHNSLSRKVDRKWSYELLSCNRCALLYRYPYESSSHMKKFYQKDYEQSGLTTDLPVSSELQRLISVNFADTEKDYTPAIRVLQALGVRSGGRILDYGANWGYGVFQFGKAGFDSIGFEVSEPRAQYAANLGVVVHTHQEEIIGPFDVVYSKHVLEHVPDPRASLEEQWGLVRPGGCLIAETPNGSAGRQKADPKGFHTNWGQVHPVLLTNEFVQRMFKDEAYYISSEVNIEEVSRWDQRQAILDAHDKHNLQFIIKKQKT